MLGLLKNSIANLKGHKLRIIVAFIWIIVGITSVIFISSLGNALKKEISQSFETIQPNTATILFEPNEENFDYTLAYSAFRQSDKESLRLIDGVEDVKASNMVTTDFSMGNQSTNASLAGVETSLSISYPKEKKDRVKILEGRNLSDQDKGRNSIIITNEAKKELSRNIKGKVLGKAITINGVNYEVVGILDEKYKYDPDEEKFVKTSEYVGDIPTSYVSKESFDKLTGRNENTNLIGSFKLTLNKDADPQAVGDQALQILNENHPDLKTGTFKVEDQSTITKQFEQITGSIDRFVKTMTVIAMGIGGIGIMNIMYVSVMERHREIGIRRALGAKKRDIIFQFLIESVFITNCGGVLGIIIGTIVTYYSRNLMPYKPIITFSSIIYAVLTVIITGIIFGIVPASKAANLDPIDAIYK